MSLSEFHPLIERWFRGRFAAPTRPQAEGWPHIAAGKNVLIAAPTGSGKTLTAFLAVIDRLLRASIAGQLEAGTRVVYVSPLRALSNDMHRNLSEPLQELNALAVAEFPDVPMAELRAGLRTGDTTASQRAALVRKPPHILVTTPESLFLLLTSPRGRAALKTVDTVIIDEIHALIRDKRGSHLALSIERLEALCERPLQRIGLSATQKPIERVAAFLTGDEQRCTIVDTGHVRDLDLRIEVPPGELSAVCSTEQWREVSQQIIDLINSHRSTLIFVNTRRMAERVTHQLTELLGDDQVGSHHGSLSSDIRLRTEQRLKSGELRAVVATASLELGLDVGFIDLVIQIGSPRSIATFLQRIGRSGHSLGKTPKGRLFALTRDELIECMALMRAVRSGRLDVVPIPEAPLDVLVQQIVGEVAGREWNTDELFALCRRAWPYRNLERKDFDEVLQILSEGLSTHAGRGRTYLHHDMVQRRVRSRPGANIAASSNAGAIPEVAEFRVLAEPDHTVVGTLDEDFATESHPGQIMLLGNTSWRIEGVRGTDVLVSDAGGAPPTIPFWRGEAPGRTIELSEEVSRLRDELEARVSGNPGETGPEQSTIDWLIRETGCSDFAARQTVLYVAAQKAAVGVVPTQKRVIFERFFDETGGMQMVVHAPFGSRITHAWGLAMRKRFCRSFDFELQATADDDGFILSLGPQHSFPLESMFPMLTADNVRRLLEQAILYIPMFKIRWRWNANRALLVLRRDKGRRVPPALQRFRADDLLTSVFPLLTGCQENITGDLELPDHPLCRQTMHDCLTEALDIEGLERVLRDVQEGRIEFIARDTREPSPFSYELLNANPYAFLDGGEIAERRARAVATRRSLSVESVSDLGRLDPLAIEQVVAEAQPPVRNADELHDVLFSRFVLPADRAECEQLDPGGLLFQELAAQKRAARVTTTDGRLFVVAAERLPAVQAMLPVSGLDPVISAPDGVRTTWTDIEARIAAMRGLLEVSGPITHLEAADTTGMPVSQAFAVLEALEGEGCVLRGRYRNPPAGDVDAPIEWCHRRLLARIHRQTIEGLRKQIEPVSIEVFFRFLADHHGLTATSRRAGPNGLFEVIAMLQGLDIPAAAWERDILPARVEHYRPELLDELCLTGETGWGRLYPPQREGTSVAGVSRVMPVSLFLRGDLAWLVDAVPAESLESLSPPARQVRETLMTSGAVFATDLMHECRLSASDLNEALGELVSHGLVTADGFGGLRSLTDSSSQSLSAVIRRPGLARSRAAAGSTGRWSVWRRTAVSESESESPSASSDRTAVVEQWAWQLLRRWGVVFRDLLAREAGAPRWWELLPVLRRLEARGEIRGGRFIAGVAGEQFALGETVRRLRHLRESPPAASIKRTATVRAAVLQAFESDSVLEASSRPAAQTHDLTNLPSGPPLLVLSATDPLNLIGIVTPHARVPALPHNRLVFRSGQPVAALVNQEVVWLERLPAHQQSDVFHVLGIATGSTDPAVNSPESQESGPSREPSSLSQKRRSIRPVIH